jgi:hypothetical protein
MQSELDYSIIAITLTGLGPDLEPFQKEMGPTRADTETSVHLSSISANAQSQRRSMKEDLGPLRPDIKGNTAEVSHGTWTDAASLASHDSKRKIITKQIQWSVARENETGAADE